MPGVFRLFLLGAGLLALVTACAPAASTATPVETDQVKMAKSYRFEPAVIRVKVGTTVTWVNDDNFTHDVTFTAGPAQFHSPPLRPGEKTSFTFSRPGEYQYQCSFHPQDMKGKVIVEGAGSSGY
jgi:amicyanin